MKTKLLLCLILIFISACAGPGKGVIDFTSEDKAQGRKEVAIIGQQASFMKHIESELRKRGFTIKKFATRAEVARLVEPATVEKTREASTRYLLEFDWEIVDQCFGGGFWFRSLRAHLIDVNKNEDVLIVEGKGYSEYCQPLSGTIFQDIASAIDQYWR